MAALWPGRPVYASASLLTIAWACCARLQVGYLYQDAEEILTRISTMAAAEQHQQQLLHTQGSAAPEAAEADGAGPSSSKQARRTRQAAAAAPAAGTSSAVLARLASSGAAILDLDDELQLGGGGGAAGLEGATAPMASLLLAGSQPGGAARSPGLMALALSQHVSCARGRGGSHAGLLHLLPLQLARSVCQASSSPQLALPLKLA